MFNLSKIIIPFTHKMTIIGGLFYGARSFFAITSIEKIGPDDMFSSNLDIIAERLVKTKYQNVLYDTIVGACIGRLWPISFIYWSAYYFDKYIYSFLPSEPLSFKSKFLKFSYDRNQ